MIQQINSRRFTGIARLYGDKGFAQLQAARICVIGLGGVGSWVVEALARSAVGAITLIDLDVVAESNINRQCLAVTETIGRDKVAVMAERIKAINPQSQVTEIDCFITVENVAELIHGEFDFVIDCIDDFRTKAALIDHCKGHKINIITVGGAGGQVDPGKVRQADLSNTKHDALLATTRKLLRQNYGFTRNPKRIFGIPCVYSDEQAVYPDGKGGLSRQRPDSDSETGSGLSCAGDLGSVTHLTASFAFVAVSHVLNQLSQKQ